MFSLKHQYCGDYDACLKKSGIYKIHFVGSEKFYVGSAACFSTRWGLHRWELRRRSHNNRALQHGFDKYGEANLRFTILEMVEEKLQLIPREQFWMDTLKPQYNFLKKAGSQLGLVHSAETRAKIGAIHKGRIKSPETIAKWMESMRRVNGFAATPEKIAKLTGQKRTPETRARLSAARKGWKPTAETNAKISATKRAQHLKFVVTPEWRESVKQCAKSREVKNRIAKYGYSPENWESMDLNAQLKWKRANRHLLQKS